MRCSRSRDRRRGVAAAALLLLAACARVAPAPPPPAPTGDPLAIVRQRAASLRTLRAQFDSVARFPGGEREAAGVLIVRQPGDARLRLVAPFGFTVFDGLRTGGRTYVEAPLASNREQASLAFMRVGPADSVLFGAGAEATCRSSDDASAGRAEYWCGTPPSRWIAIDRATATLVAETELENGTPIATRSYGDYRDVAGTPLPYRIRIDYPQKQTSVDITVTRYELNPPLRDDQFAPPRGAALQGPMAYGAWRMAGVATPARRTVPHSAAIQLAACGSGPRQKAKGKRQKAKGLEGRAFARPARLATVAARGESVAREKSPRAGGGPKPATTSSVRQKPRPASFRAHRTPSHCEARVGPSLRAPTPATRTGRAEARPSNPFAFCLLPFAFCLESHPDAANWFENRRRVGGELKPAATSRAGQHRA